MSALWAIQHTTTAGRTWLDHTTVRCTRSECWRAFDKAQEGSTAKWHAEVKRRRRKGLIRAVKVTLKEAGNG